MSLQSRSKKRFQVLKKALEMGETFPLYQYSCGNTTQCLLGPAALADKEAVTVFRRFKRVSDHGGDLS